MDKILLATTNVAKAATLRWLLDGLGVHSVTPRDLGLSLSVPEEGATHRENAEAKALAWSNAAGMPAIASDGGLVIPALGGRWEPLLTARFAGSAATDRDRLDRLLELLRPYQGGQRMAYWREAVAVAGPKDRLIPAAFPTDNIDRPPGGRLDTGILASWDAQSQPGVLDSSYDPERIQPGFWAFTVWRIPELGKTYAELSPADIERLEDHWGLLRAKVREWWKGRGIPEGRP